MNKDLHIIIYEVTLLPVSWNCRYLFQSVKFCVGKYTRLL